MPTCDFMIKHMNCTYLAIITHLSGEYSGFVTDKKSVA